MHKEYTFYFCNPLHFLLNFYIMKKIFLFFFVFFTLAALLGAFQMKKKLDSVSLNDQTTLIEIPNGTPASRVGEILAKKGIWTDELTYKVWNKLKQPSIQKGWYEIPPHVTLDEIAAILASGKTATRRVTIPEGRASWEIPAYLKKAFPDLNEDRWNKLVHDAKFAKSLGIDAKSLEGYLLPDTYPFPIDANEETILRQMVAANLKFRDQLEKDTRPSKWKELGNWHRVLTLASVVEEETGIPEERPLIAGVFHNRLKIDMPLGADPTVRFIFKNLTGPIYKSQLNSNSPYNTRKFKGLMPGPISNPGRKAIDAALHPAETDALYFVAKDDGSMTHFFSKTLADHNKYKDIAAKNRGE